MDFDKAQQLVLFWSNGAPIGEDKLVEAIDTIAEGNVDEDISKIFSMDAAMERRRNLEEYGIPYAEHYDQDEELEEELEKKKEKSE